MSSILHISNFFNSKNPCDFVHNFSQRSHFNAFQSFKQALLLNKSSVLLGKGHAATRQHEEGSLQQLDESPLLVKLESVSSETQFDQFIAEAQQVDAPVIFVWMASWCRKCIYLKPKLEKLAAEYYPRLRFYCVDVNAVSHKLVSRAGVTKMPTIQLWKDGLQQAEVIGGHKAHLVVNEVTQMIEGEYDI